MHDVRACSKEDVLLAASGMQGPARFERSRHLPTLTPGQEALPYFRSSLARADRLAPEGF